MGNERRVGTQVLAPPQLALTASWILSPDDEAGETLIRLRLGGLGRFNGGETEAVWGGASLATPTTISMVRVGRKDGGQREREQRVKERWFTVRVGILEVVAHGG